MGNSMIPLMVNPPPQPQGPLDQARAGMSLQALINETKLQQQQQQSNAVTQQEQQIQLQQKQQQQQDMQKFNQAFTEAGGNWDQAIQKATEAGASGQFITQAQIGRTKMISDLATANEKVLANEKAKHEAYAQDMAEVNALPADQQQQRYNELINGHLQAGTLKPGEFSPTLPSADQRQAIINTSKAMVDTLSEADKLRRAQEADPTVAAENQAKKIQAGATQLANASSDPIYQLQLNSLRKQGFTSDDLKSYPATWTPDTPKQLQQTAIGPVEQAKLQAQIPTEKLELQSFMQNPPKGYKATPAEFLRYQKSIVPILNLNLQNQAGGGLNQNAIDQAAERYATTGVLPPTARGAAGLAQNRVIMNRASELYPQGSIAQNSAIYSANKSSLTNIQKNFDNVSAFENTAGKNLDQFISTAKNIVDSGSPLINTPVRAVSDKIAGSANMAAFNAARTTALTEIAKVLNSSNASGVLSDSARGEVSSLIGPDATLAQIYSAANILRTDMANRHQSYQEQINDIQGRLGEKSRTQTTAATGGGGVTIPAGAKTATGPGGHKIFVQGDQWIDSVTGKPVQ
jgi:hypothetical protein